MFILQLWSEQTPLNFKETAGFPDIEIFFASGNHGDGGAFDGPSGVLAHAFFPQTGDAHFDEDETWAVRDNGNYEKT